MKPILLAIGFFALFFPAAIHSAMPESITPSWTEVAPGVWKTAVGQADLLTLLGAAGGTPYREALARMPKVQ